MSQAIFPLKMPAKRKEVIHDLAKSENRTPTDLINEAVKQYPLITCN